ncbi:MAG: transglycosylase domain-containing protein [Rhodoglobus sp.]
MSAQKSPRRGVLSAAVGLLGFSVLSGLLVTVMVAPAVAVTGITASSAIGIFDSLPEYLEIGHQSERNELWATYTGPGNVNGYELIATIFDQNRQEVPYEEISPYAREAAVDGEDRRFFEHGGVDVSSVVRAAVGNAAGTSASGASTLSMQLVKNIFVQQALLEPTQALQKKAYADATAPDFNRKLKEMKLAIGLEKSYTKKEILTAYLNIAFFGSNTYGIQAAAQRYYSVDAKDLTLPEAASLIAIVQYPNERALDTPKNYKANKARRDVILNNMHQVGDITQKELSTALASPVDDTTVKPHAPVNGCIGANAYATWFCDYVVKNVDNYAFLGTDVKTREANWKAGGYKLYTTLDMDIQVNAQNVTWQYANNAETQLALGSTSVAVQPGTGRVLMMTENKIFNDSLDGGGPTTTAVNFNTNKKYGGSSGFPPGSSYKLFTLVDWLKSGKGIYEKVNGDERVIQQSKFKDSCQGGWGGTYSPTNDAAGEGGPQTVYNATLNSVNGAFISMALQLDLCDIRHVAESMGVERADGTPLQTNPSSVLGTNEVTPLSMAGAYATIAAGGKYCTPIIVDRAVDPSGAVLPGQSSDCHQAIDPDIAATVAFVLQGVMSNGTGTRSNPEDGVPILGKTGTADGAVHTWIITSTTAVATATWVGNIVDRYQLYDYEWADWGGNNLRHPIMAATALVTNSKYGGGAFPTPSGVLLGGSGLQVPDVRGLSPEKAKALLEGLGFTYVDGGPVDSEVPLGMVVSTDPPAGSQSAAGTTITVTTSKGNLVQFPDVVLDGKTNTLAQAHAALNAAGYMTITDSCSVIAPAPVTIPPTPVTPDPREGKVSASSPAPGTYVLPHAAVTLTYTKAICP